MTFSLRRVATLSLGIAVLGFFIGYSPAVLQCFDVGKCVASLSIYQDGVEPVLYGTSIAAYSGISGSSLTANPSLRPSFWEVLFEGIQVTSIYLLLLSVLVLILLELKELKYLRLLVAKKHKH